MTTIFDSENPIKFRTKFVKRIDDPEILNHLSKIIHELNNKSVEYLIDLLWKLTYDPDEYVYLIGLSTYPFSCNIPYIYPDLIIPIRNEIRFQYIQSGHPSFSVVKVSDDCKEAFSALQSKIEKDPELQSIASIVLTIILIACNKANNNSQLNITRSIFLLKSNIESYIFGGILSIGFTIEEAQVLKPFAYEIGLLLESTSK